MRDDNEWLRLANYLAGRASVTERAAFERWMGEAPERHELVEAMHHVWERAGELHEPVGPVDAEQAWRAIAPQLGMEAIPRPPMPRAIPYRLRLLRSSDARAAGRKPRAVSAILGAAAAVLVVAGAGWLVHMGNHDMSGSASAPMAMREVKTDAGQRAELRLDDGSRVVLGVDSRLRWSDAFGEHTRDVYLDGEALFEVTHDRRHTFRVHTAGGVAEDVGTLFVVRAYPGDERVLVAVKEGAVAIAPSRNAAAPRSVLRAGDLGLMAPSGRTTIERGIDVDRYLAFASGRLVFERVPMRNVAAELERWYDVRVVIADSSLTGVLVSASFRNEGLRDVLAMLTTTLGASAEQRGRTVTLHARP